MTTEERDTATGPWHQGRYALGLNVWRHIVKDDASELVAVIYGDHDERYARQIALVPELLELVKDMVKAPEHVSAWVEEAERLIARATGQDERIPFELTEQGRAACR